MQETLGWLYQIRFNSTSDVSALEKALVHFLAAVHDADDKPVCLPCRQEAVAFIYTLLYLTTGVLNHINLSIDWFHLAVNSCPSDNPMIFLWVMKLALAYSHCYNHQKNVDDLEQSLKHNRAALGLISSDHPAFLQFSQEVGWCYCRRFARLRDTKDLNKGIDVLLGAVKISPQGHLGLPAAWKMLSFLYVTRFRIEGNQEDLETAISSGKLAVEGASPGSQEYIIYTFYLGGLYAERYKCFSSFDDLGLAMKYVQQAIHEAPCEEPAYAMMIGELGNLLSMKYKSKGGDENIKLAIQYMEFLVNSLPLGDEMMPVAQGNLATGYLLRYSSKGDVEDLKKAEIIVENTPKGLHSEDSLMYDFHDRLAAAKFTHYSRSGDLHDLSLSLDHSKLALESILLASYDVAVCERNIAHNYKTRYRRLGDHKDLDLAIQYSLQSLQHMSQNNEDFPLLKGDLASLYYDKFRHHNEIDDLDSAMKLQRDALDAVSENSPKQPFLLNALAILHVAYFEVTYDRDHLEAAFKLMEPCIKLAIEIHDDVLHLPEYYSTLAEIMVGFWQGFTDTTWITAAAEMCEAGVDITQPDHPLLSTLYTMLGQIFSILYHHSQDNDDFSTLHEFSMVEDAYCVLYYYRASVALSMTPLTQLETAIVWASFSMDLNLNEALTAYSSALATLPNILWIGNSLGDRHNSLIKLNIPDLVSSAVAAAVKFNDIKCAVEFLEQGLAVTYRQILELKDEPTHLIEKHPKIGLEFQEISLKLQEINDPLKNNKEDHHSLVIRQKDVIEEIRTLSGFEDFLLPKSFEKLSEAAKYGPVILLNASSGTSQAIILLPSAHESAPNPLSVPLPDATVANLKDHCEILKQALRMHNIFSRETERGGKPSNSRSAELSHKMFKNLLTWLWKAIVKPVFDVLELVSKNSL